MINSSIESELGEKFSVCVCWSNDNVFIAELRKVTGVTGTIDTGRLERRQHLYTHIHTAAREKTPAIY